MLKAELKRLPPTVEPWCWAAVLTRAAARAAVHRAGLIVFPTAGSNGTPSLCPDSGGLGRKSPLSSATRGQMGCFPAQLPALPEALKASCTGLLCSVFCVPSPIQLHRSALLAVFSRRSPGWPLQSLSPGLACAESSTTHRHRHPDLPCILPDWSPLLSLLPSSYLDSSFWGQHTLIAS